MTEDDNANLTTAASDFPNQNTFPSLLHPAMQMTSNHLNHIDRIDREDSFRKVLFAPKHYQVIFKIFFVYFQYIYSLMFIPYC